MTTDVPTFYFALYKALNPNVSLSAAQSDVLDRNGSTALADSREVIDLADPVGDLAEAWLAVDLSPPLASPLTAFSCDVGGCNAIPFVRLRTSAGRHELCLCHFQSVRTRTRYIGRTRERAM